MTECEPEKAAGRLAWRGHSLPLDGHGDSRTSHHQGCGYAQNPGLHEYMDPPGFCCALDGGSPGRAMRSAIKGKGAMRAGVLADDDVSIKVEPMTVPPSRDANEASALPPG